MRHSFVVPTFLTLPFVSGLLFLLLMMAGCSDNRQGEEFSFERQPQGFLATTEGEGESLHWVLQWEPPADLERLVAYHLWAVLAEESGEISRFIERQTGFDDDIRPSRLPSGILHWAIPLDSATSDLMVWQIPDSVQTIAQKEQRHTVRWLLWAEYSRGRAGNRLSTRVYYRDVFPPEPVIATAEPYADSVRLFWKRPFDLSDHLNPDQPGILFGYRLLLVARHSPFSKEVTLTPWSGFEKGDLYPNSTVAPSEEAPLSADQIKNWPARDDSLSFVLLDGKRLSGDDPFDNLLGVTIHGLRPRQEYIARIVAYDSLGVLRDLDDNPAEVRLLEFSTTDNSPPTFNGPLTIEPTALPGLFSVGFREATDPDNPIVGYRFRRIDRDTAEGFADTLEWALELDELLVQGRFLYAPLDYLVPALQVSLEVRAVDASGHRSAPVDTTFTLPSSVDLDCPAGMVALSGGEKLEHFCMERFEHRDSTGFTTQVMWSEARELCQQLSGGGWEVDLCSEAEWEQACSEGTDRLWGLLNYDEDYLPQQLLQECQLGSGDSSASASTSTRSLRCTTGEGVRDLPGHYQEWVVGPSEDAERIKGGSWMRANGIDQSTQQLLASCRAHSKGSWMRPKFVLRGKKDTLFVLGDSTRFELDRTDSLLMLRVTDTLLWNSGDSVQAYTIYRNSAASEKLGSDTLRHYPTRPGWVEVNANGLDYRVDGKPLPAFFLGEKLVKPGALYQHRTVGFRCCARK